MIKAHICLTKGVSPEGPADLSQGLRGAKPPWKTEFNRIFLYPMFTDAVGKLSIKGLKREGCVPSSGFLPSILVTIRSEGRQVLEVGQEGVQP